MSVTELEQEVVRLKRLLHDKEYELANTKYNALQQNTEDGGKRKADKLSNQEIARFSRQLILPEIGVKGQLAMKNSSVLIVGAGGLGCPAALYLAGAGIGHLGIIDYDAVELNNLHRQLLHTEAAIGQTKVQSAAQSLKRLNCAMRVSTYHTQLNSHNALKIIKEFDVVLDATDNVATRYLLNDACVLLHRPLVSGSALHMEGQLTVYNHKQAPCYRCLFPVPPPPEAVTNCSDGGVLGVVPGVIGVLQALEAIGIILDRPGVLTARLLVFDASDCSFRNIRLRDKNPECEVCGVDPKVTALMDYEKFCGTRACDKVQAVQLLDEVDRVTPSQYQQVVSSHQPHVLIDVRPPTEFDICHLEQAVNIPLSELTTRAGLLRVRTCIMERKAEGDSDFTVFTVCRRGNDSQRAVLKLRPVLAEVGVGVKDVVGGLQGWSHQVDRTFPVY